MKTIPLLLILATISACKTADTPAITSASINAKAPYLWTNYGSAKVLRISNSFSPDEEANIVAMGAAWKAAVSNEKSFFEHGTTRITEKTNTISNLDLLLDDTLGIYKTTNWPDDLPGSALAVTQLFGRRYNTGGQNEYVGIEHADILVNYDFYSFDTDETGNGFDLRTVVLHEMGHFVGLVHKSITSNPAASVMYPSVGPDSVKRAPTSIDTGDIRSKYHIGVSGQAKYKDGVPGDKIRVLLELHANGECVHKVDGATVGRHQVEVKK